MMIDMLMASRMICVCVVIMMCGFSAGCGTSSRVDQFVQQADQAIIVTPSSLSGSSTSNTQSDELLLHSTDTQDDTDGQRGIYKNYTSELVSQAKNSSQRVVIIVYESTNENCVKLEKAVNSALGRIPSDVMILKLDYNQARTLYQTKEMNTVIYLDATGKITNTSDGGIYTMDSLLYYL